MPGRASGKTTNDTVARRNMAHFEEIGDGIVAHLLFRSSESPRTAADGRAAVDPSFFAWDCCAYRYGSTRIVGSRVECPLIVTGLTIRSSPGGKGDRGWTAGD